MENQSLLANQNSFVARVYGLMGLMLGFTAISSAVSWSLGLVSWLAVNPAVLMCLFALQLLLVFYYSLYFGGKAEEQMNLNRPGMQFLAGFLMLLFTGLEGITLSGFLANYNPGTIIATFGLSTMVFCGATAFGMLTKRSLNDWGVWLFVGLCGLLASILLNAFVLHSRPVEYLLTGAGIVLFVMIAMFDAQKIQERSWCSTAPTFSEHLFMALEVYLDFLNILVRILQLFGFVTKQDNE